VSTSSASSHWIGEHVEREIAERVVEADARRDVGRSRSFAFEALGSARHVLALDRELGECVPRQAARRIDADRRLVVLRRVRRLERANLGLTGADEPEADGLCIRGRIGVVGERAQMNRSLAPQLACEAALAEGQRDLQVAAREVMRLVKQLVRFVGVSERSRHTRGTKHEPRDRLGRCVFVGLAERAA
jgi:hypothetical protein